MEIVNPALSFGDADELGALLDEAGCGKIGWWIVRSFPMFTTFPGSLKMIISSPSTTLCRFGDRKS